MAKEEEAPDTSGAELRTLITIGDEMAELLRGLIVHPMLRIQDAARLPELIDGWRKAKEQIK